VGNPASSVQQVSSKWPANTCRSVLSTRHSCLGAYSTSMEGGLGARSCPARLLLTLKFQPKQTPLGWLALAGGNEEAAGRGLAPILAGHTRNKKLRSPGSHSLLQPSSPPHPLTIHRLALATAPSAVCAELVCSAASAGLN
jgi:hypothetical protein